MKCVVLSFDVYFDNGLICFCFRVSAKVPVSCLNLPGEPMTLTKLALREKYPKLRYTLAKIGGHFNLLQIPEIVVKDLIEAINFMDNT